MRAVKMLAMRNTRVVLTALGGPEVLKVIEDEIRDPAANEVRVRILACGVAFADVLMRRGTLFRRASASLFSRLRYCRHVDSCGAAVTEWKSGDVVAAITQTGGYSRYIVLPESELVRVPAGLDPAEAVSLVLNYTTAYQLIHRIAKSACRRERADSWSRRRSRNGRAATRLAGRIENVWHRIQAKHDLVAALGGIPIDYRTEDFVPARRWRGSAVFDPIGGRNWLRSYRALGKGGRFIGYGMSAAIEGGRRNDASRRRKLRVARLSRPASGKIGALVQHHDVRRRNIPSGFARISRDCLPCFEEKSIRPVVAERLAAARCGPRDTSCSSVLPSAERSC